MVGQGRPRTSRAAHACARIPASPIWRCALALAFVLGLASTAVANESIRVRIAWGGGTEQLWHGAISVSSGTLEQLEPLGIEADEPAGMWIEHNQLVVRQRSRRTYDGLDLLVTAPRDARLLVELSGSPDREEATRIEIPLREVLAEPWTADLDASGSRLLARRTPGDMLRVYFKQHSLVFAPGELFSLNLEPHLLPLPDGSEMEIEIALLAARGSKQLWVEHRRATAGRATTIPLEIALPDEEGAYDLVFTAKQAPGLRLPQGGHVPLGWKKAIAQRKIQLLVLDPNSPRNARDSQGKLTEVVQIDPANPKRWKNFAKLPQIPGLPRLWKGPLSDGNTHIRRHALGKVVELAQSGEANDVSWEAYSLPISQPGMPHVLEVDCPSDLAQTLGISVMEPDAAGAMMPIQLDSGVAQTHEPGDERQRDSPRWIRHRLIFWPSTKAPMVLVTNLRRDRPAAYGRIRVLAGWKHLPRTFADQTGPPERLLAAYFDRPLFAQSFSASESLDSWSGRSLDDWVTFHQGGSRLVEYLQYVGMNGLMISVLADGSTLYPSRVLQPTPRYDKGVFFNTGQDPVRKDVLEMLLRLFDREQLRLIPALEFGAPLPELEAVLRRGGPESVGIQWIGPDGTAWQETYEPRRGLAPYYNVLDPRVQEAMLSVVREVATTYAGHPSCAGLALQLSAYGYAQLPGPDWGMDDVTVAQFEQDTGLRVAASGEHRFAERAEALNSEEYREAWVAWRCRRLSRFYQRVQDELKAIRPDGRLYLAGADMFAGEEQQYLLRPALPRRLTVTEAMRQVGIDPASYAGSNAPILLRPELIAPLASAVAEAVDRELRQMPDLDRCFSDFTKPGCLFFHPPRTLDAPSFDKKNSFRASYTSLIAQPALADAQNRRRFVHALATLDAQTMFDGGWMLPMGQEDSLRDLVAVYRRLPGVRFQRVQDPAGAESPQPVTFRYADYAGAKYVYAVNDTPLSARARLDVEAPGGCHLSELTGRRQVAPLTRDALGTHWTVELGPYDVVAVRLSSQDTKLSVSEVRLGKQVVADLDDRIRQLSGRVATLRDPPVLPVVANPGFEEPSDTSGRIPAWVVSKRSGTNVYLDRGRTGKESQSVVLEGSGPTVSLVSQAFEAPSTGRLSMSVWLRTATSDQQPPLRLALQGRCVGRDYHRFATVGLPPHGGVPDNPIGTNWQRFILRIDDVPLEGLSDLRVRFELAGAGKVWIDDVQLYHLDFDRSEQVELAKLINLADFKLRKGQVRDCLHLLDGYWLRFLEDQVPSDVEDQVPSDAAALAQRAAPATPPSRQPTPEPKRPNTLLDKVKGLWPQKLRF